MKDPMIELSVIIPTYQEKADSFVARALRAYPDDPRIEYLVVDCETTSDIKAQLRRPGLTFIDAPGSNRAQRLAMGLAQAKGELIVFHHPRSLLDPEALFYLLSLGNKKLWGGFTHSFDQKGMMLRWTSWYSNNIRPRLFGIVYLDHCLFFHRSLLTRPLPEIPIFEDTAISEILREQGSPKI